MASQTLRMRAFPDPNAARLEPSGWPASGDKLNRPVLSRDGRGIGADDLG
jgi:hypothetical protein